MRAGLTFLAWRVTYQSDEQAMRAAFDRMCVLTKELATANAQLAAIARLAAPSPVGITRSPGRCIGCNCMQDDLHAAGCVVAAFTSSKAA